MCFACVKPCFTSINHSWLSDTLVSLSRTYVKQFQEFFGTLKSKTRYLLVSEGALHSCHDQRQPALWIVGDTEFVPRTIFLSGCWLQNDKKLDSESGVGKLKPPMCRQHY